ncbi:hypothetical protein [Paenibacillus sp. FSL R7-0331]|uniref:hypothetical protein n=1 Tax=Paenibacillus sp. FSL R7-0331 TaxID=1536773 RepID=UPI0004F59841|nr:hypothetical protein [Paenibacillus sp. FSL R7-0331]AIQ54555.1 hypothetical protein R70331_25605 [Paenibacillus sp. FSL R7-0331]
MLEPLYFMLFSNLEAFAWCAICMSLFRFKIQEFAWQSLVVVTLMNLQSFVLRNELSLSYLVPFINIIFVTLLFAAIVRMPLLGALTVSIAGFVVFGLVQAVIALLLFGSIDGVGESAMNGYMLQIATAIIVLPMSWLLYRYGYGFSYSFEIFRFKNERTLLIVTIIAFMLAITAVLYLNDLWFVIALFVLSLMFFLKYAIQKEKTYD